MSPTLRMVLAAACAAALGLGARAWYEAGRAGSTAGFADETGEVVDGLPATPSPASSGAQPLGALLEKQVEPIRLPDLDGNIVELASIAPGRPLLVNVWASWCQPCIEEMPELQRFAQSQGEDGVQVVGLALDDADSVRAFLRHVPVAYPILLDTPGPADASVTLGNTRGLLPYTVVLDTRGRIAGQHLGPFKAGAIDAWVSSMKLYPHHFQTTD